VAEDPLSEGPLSEGLLVEGPLVEGPLVEGPTPDIDADAVETAFGSTLASLCSGLPAAIPCQSLISAVSGGPDSMCLVVLARNYAAQRGLDHRAIIVDHGVRPDSAAEARRVCSRLRGEGIQAEVMRVDAPAPKTGIQDWARRVRYACLLQAARRHRAVILLGHHRDDQAETVMMRLSRGSGLAGLAAMRGATLRQGVALLRPLLGVDRASIHSFCKAHGIVFETDPSNEDRRFERVRLRQWLAGAGAIAGRDLCRFSKAAASIDDALLAALRRHRLLPMPEPGGHLYLRAASLALPDDIAMRLLAHLICQMTAAAHPPTRMALSGLVGRLRAGRASTLGGVRFTADGHDWLVTAEIGRRALRVPVAAGDDVIFAGTWRVTSPVDATVRRLGTSGSGAGAPWEDCHGWTRLPPLARRSVPVLETLDGALQYPHLSPYELSRVGADEAVAEFLPHCLAPHQGAMTTYDLNLAAAGMSLPGAAAPV
jgi:tRNA(Ile)-lysidine synthase